MTYIWEFPELGQLEEYLTDMMELAQDIYVQDDVEGADDVARLNLERLVIYGDWTTGEAEISETPVEFYAFYSMDGVEEEEHLDPDFEPALQRLSSVYQRVLDDEQWAPTVEAQEWFPSFDVAGTAISFYEEQLMYYLQQRAGNQVFDLTYARAIEYREGVEFERLPRTPLEILRQELKEEQAEEEEESEGEGTEEDEEQTEEEEVEDEEVQPTAEELLAEKFPEIDENLREFARDDGVLELPAGKETVAIERVEPYDFEVQAGEPGFISRIPITETFDGMIGQSYYDGRFGEEDAPGTFPRTGRYIRARLNYQGPAYIYELYKDLVFYAGYISGFYGYDFNPGRYSSFREYIYILLEIPRRDAGPELIRKIPDAEAREQGLDTIPDHPTIEDAKAPWLERRQYIELIEENTDHPAWSNPYDFLHGQQ